VSPQYDSSEPFEFICEEKINDIWEDVSTIEGDHKVSYSIFSVGDYLSNVEDDYINVDLLEILTNSAYREGCADNQWKAKPVATYNGICLNVAICCEFSQNGIVIGKLNAPIHYLLNRYGLAHINEWDGNSIQINENGGFILAPQMGSGFKDANNNFTGVLMG